MTARPNASVAVVILSAVSTAHAAPLGGKHAPDAPILVSPPDGGIAETLDVALTVAVSDPDADTLSVSYSGRFVPADRDHSGASCDRDELSPQVLQRDVSQTPPDSVLRDERRLA